MKTALLVLLHHSFGTNSSDIALSARMSASSFAGSPQCAFTLTRKVAVPAPVLAQSNSIASRKMSASGALANVAFSPSPIHLIIALRSAYLSHKYNMGLSFGVSRNARTRAANSGRFELESSS